MSCDSHTSHHRFRIDGLMYKLGAELDSMSSYQVKFYFRGELKDNQEVREYFADPTNSQMYNNAVNARINVNTIDIAAIPLSWSFAITQIGKGE